MHQQNSKSKDTTGGDHRDARLIDDRNHDLAFFETDRGVVNFLLAVIVADITKAIHCSRNRVSSASATRYLTHSPEPYTYLVEITDYND